MVGIVGRGRAAGRGSRSGTAAGSWTGAGQAARRVAAGGAGRPPRPVGGRWPASAGGQARHGLRAGLERAAGGHDAHAGHAAEHGRDDAASADAARDRRDDEPDHRGQEHDHADGEHQRDGLAVVPGSGGDHDRAAGRHDQRGHGLVQQEREQPSHDLAERLPAGLRPAHRRPHGRDADHDGQQAGAQVAEHLADEVAEPHDDGEGQGDGQVEVEELARGEGVVAPRGLHHRGGRLEYAGGPRVHGALEQVDEPRQAHAGEHGPHERLAQWDQVAALLRGDELEAGREHAAHGGDQEERVDLEPHPV